MCCRWIVLACVTGVVLCQTPGTDRPDITMLYRENSQICVAGGNTNGYGLAFMSETLESAVYVNQFEYKDEKGAIIDNSSNCDFENIFDNIYKLNWWSNGIGSRQSGSHPLSPVTDERWNNFEIYRTDARTDLISRRYEKKYDIKRVNFYTGFSVRSTTNAQILLCSTQHPVSSACYCIIIDGFNSSTLTGIRKCVQGVPDKWPTEPDCIMLRNNITIPNKLLNESKWTHFLLSREGTGNRFRLWLWDLDSGARPLLDYTDDDPLSLSYMFVRSYDFIADWKIHNYRYLNILYKKGPIRLGPTLNFTKLSSICVSLYATICSTCKMEITLESENGTTKMQSSIEGNSDGPFMTWRHVKILGGVSTSAVYNYHLYVTLNTTDGKYVKTYWAIDDFRKCSDKEIRIASSNSNEKLLCHSLKQPEWVFKPDIIVQNYNVSPICSNESYIGQHCNITCHSLHTYLGCARYKICLSSQDDNSKGACTCAAGYTWDSNCVRRCAYGYYGYNCKNKCGKCKTSPCSRYTGVCFGGCEDGYLLPYCQLAIPRLVAPPVVIEELYTSVTVLFNDTRIDGAVDTVQLIELEFKKNGEMHWTNYSVPFKLSPGLKVSVTGLEKQTLYFIRAVLYISNGYAYRNENLPTTHATTGCKVNRIAHITENSRNVTFSFETTSESCSLDTYTIKWQQNSGTQRKGSPQVASQVMIFKNLTPYTEYVIVLNSTLYSNYTQTFSFKTKEDAPGEINNLTVWKITDTKIDLSWKEPVEMNGVIKKYILTYEFIQRIGCNYKPISKTYNITVNPSEVTNVTVSDLQPYSTYYITVAAETILPGKKKGFNCNTLMTSAISEEELGEPIFTFIVNAKSVAVRWHSNCIKQRGPLYFHIVSKCIQDKWCNHISDIVLDNTNSSIGRCTIPNLTPFTHYMVLLRAKRSESGDLTTFNRTREVVSHAGNPPAITNFIAYSKSTTSISLRWSNPYPPHGNLKNYKLYYYYNNTSDRKAIDINTTQLTPCNLWDEHFNCYTLRKLHTSYWYTITITAKNKESTSWSPETSLRVYTEEDRPSAPLNFTRQWKNNKLHLYWNHPNITNGRLSKFVLTVKLIEPELADQDDYFEYILSEEMKTYTYQLTKSLRPSSLYKITICGVNSHYGENKTQYTYTPPETLELNGVVTVDKQMTTDSTVTINIPSVKKDATGSISFLYVVISKINSTPKNHVVEGNNLKQDILKSASYEHAWIAKEIIEIYENKIKVLLGSEETSKSQQFNDKMVNHKLEPSTAYEITTVLINRYHNEYSTKVYHLNIRTSSKSQSKLYTLFLLLLLPIAVYFLYRFRKHKKNEATYVTPVVHIRNSYLEIIENEEISRNKENEESTEEHLYESPYSFQNSTTIINKPEDDTYDSVSSIQNPPTYMNLLSKDKSQVYANL